MPVLPEDHPLVNGLSNTAKQHHPSLYFEATSGLVLPDRLLLRGIIGAENKTVMRVEGSDKIIYSGAKKVPLLDLSVNTKLDPPLDVIPVLEAAEQAVALRIDELIRAMSEWLSTLKVGRPI